MALKTVTTAIAATLLAGTVAGTAVAQDNTASARGDQMTMRKRVQMWDANAYMTLQAAVQAQVMCRGALSEQGMRAAVAAIEHQTGEPLSPGRKLAILDDAKWSMKKDIIENGCHTARVDQALATFDSRIAPGLHTAMN